MFNSASLAAIAPTLSSILTIVVVPFIAKFSDVIGRAEVITLTLVFQVTGLIVQTTSNNFEQLTIGGFVTTIGSTGFSCLQSIIIADVTPLKNRGIFIALLDLSNLINIWVTQVISTQLATKENWRLGFTICTSIVAAGAVLVVSPLWFLQRKGEKNLGERPRRSFSWLLKQFDFVGAIILAGTLSLLLFPLITANTHKGNFKNPAIIGCLCAGAILLLVLLVWSAKYATKPMLPKRIWSDRTVMGAICGSIVSGMMVSMNYAYFYNYLVATRKIPFADAFLLARGYQMAYYIIAPITGFLMRHFKSTRRFIWIGLIIQTIGTILMIPARLPGSSDAFVVASQAIVGLGDGMTSLASIVSITGSVHRRDYAMAIGVNLMMTSILSSIASAVAGSVWTQVLPQRLRHHIVGDYNEFKIMGDVEYVKTLPEPLYTQVVAAYGDAQKILSIISASLVVVAGVFTLMMKKVDLSLDHDAQDAKFGGEVTTKEDTEFVDEKMEVADEKK
ncbi:MAG: major facilitator superfamily domain-containing protein [Linnemannia gamsii]|nr:MAG: major facilitator superfamily domain-containing protein [Linnemannia gamsii]